MITLGGSVLGGGACIGGLAWWVTDSQATCSDPSANLGDRSTACATACTITDETDAPYCMAFGDVLVAQGNPSSALEKYDAACGFGQNDACTKAAALRAKTNQ